MRYMVYIQPMGSDDVISKQDFSDYEVAVEFAETWAVNGFAYTIVEHI